MNQTCLHMILILGGGITSQTIRLNKYYRNAQNAKLVCFSVLKNVG